jgi:hypothetical protein
VIGEAARHVPDDVVAVHPELPPTCARCATSSCTSTLA